MGRHVSWLPFVEASLRSLKKKKKAIVNQSINISRIEI